MRLLVLSDTHGAFSRVDKVISQTSCDAVVFCGDGINDIRDAQAIYCDKDYYCVKGNCDYDAYGEKPTLMPVICGHKMMITHGCEVPRYKIEESLTNIAQANGCDVLFYGHTHKQVYKVIEGLTVINPGSLKYGGDYAVINIAPDGKIECECRNILF